MHPPTMHACQKDNYYFLPFVWLHWNLSMGGVLRLSPFHPCGSSMWSSRLGLDLSVEGEGGFVHVFFGNNNNGHPVEPVNVRQDFVRVGIDFFYSFPFSVFWWKVRARSSLEAVRFIFVRCELVPSLFFFPPVVFFLLFFPRKVLG